MNVTTPVVRFSDHDPTPGTLTESSASQALGTLPDVGSTKHVCAGTSEPSPGVARPPTAVIESNVAFPPGRTASVSSPALGPTNGVTVTVIVPASFWPKPSATW